MLKSALCLLIVAFAACGQTPAEKLRFDELKSLEGTWKLEEFNFEPATKEHLTVIKGDKATFADRPVRRFTIDPSKDPKWIDFIVHEKGGEKVILQGIYSIKGDTLIIYVNTGNQDRGRPTKLNDKKFDGQHYKMMRIKKT